MSWLQGRAPRLHRLLTRRDRPWPAVREAVGGLLVVAILLGSLWAYTGQEIGDSPVVVVESASMMRCSNASVQLAGDACHYDRFGRVGTIDPGDLVFVKDIDGPDDVETLAAEGTERYGAPGDVIVYLPDGRRDRTPIIHRAVFWLEIHGRDDYSIPELGLSHISSLDRPEIRRLTCEPHVACSWMSGVEQDCIPRPDARGAVHDPSGYVTRGDNNPQADPGGSVTTCPVRPDWVIGKARGEVPWVGLIKLLAADLMSGTSNYAIAPSDVKTMLFVTLGLLVGAPLLLEQVQRRRHREDTAEAQQAEPPVGPQ